MYYTPTMLWLFGMNTQKVRDSTSSETQHLEASPEITITLFWGMHRTPFICYRADTTGAPMWRRFGNGFKHQPQFIPQQCKDPCCQANRSGWCNACIYESRRDCLQPSAGRKMKLAMTGYQCKISELHSSYRKMPKINKRQKKNTDKRHRH